MEDPVRDPALRHGLAILGRAGGVGLVVGAVLGGLAVGAVAVLERDATGLEVNLVFAAVVGGLVGLVVAVVAGVAWVLVVVAGVAWVLVVERSSTARVARWAAAAAAAVTVVVISATLTHAVGWFAAGCAVAAGLVAYLAAPRLGYRKSGQPPT